MWTPYLETDAASLEESSPKDVKPNPSGGKKSQCKHNLVQSRRGSSLLTGESNLRS